VRAMQLSVNTRPERREKDRRKSYHSICPPDRGGRICNKIVAVKVSSFDFKEILYTQNTLI